MGVGVLLFCGFWNPPPVGLGDSEPEPERERESASERETQRERERESARERERHKERERERERERDSEPLREREPERERESARERDERETQRVCVRERVYRKQCPDPRPRESPPGRIKVLLPRHWTASGAYTGSHCCVRVSLRLRLPPGPARHWHLHEKTMPGPERPGDRRYLAIRLWRGLTPDSNGRRTPWCCHRA